MMLRIRTLALAAALALCCAACGGTPSQTGTEYRLYTVQTETVTGSVFSAEESIRVDEVSDEEAAEVLVNALLAGTEQAPSLFPARTRLLSCSISNRILTLSFSEEYGQLGGLALTEAEYALTLTLCQLPGVDGVRVLLEGKKIPIAPVGVLTPEQVMDSGELAEDSPA